MMLKFFKVSATADLCWFEFWVLLVRLAGGAGLDLPALLDLAEALGFFGLLAFPAGILSVVGSKICSEGLFNFTFFLGNSVFTIHNLRFLGVEQCLWCEGCLAVECVIFDAAGN